MSACRNLKWATIAAALALLFPAFAAAQTPKGRSYSPGPFDSIVISGSAMVQLSQGETDSVYVDGDDDAQAAVRLDAEGNLLKIRPGGVWKFWRDKKLQIMVTVRDLKRLDINGAADVTAAEPMRLGRLAVNISGAGLVRFDQLTADDLSFNVSGAGDGQMAGVVNQLSVRISGRSDFRGDKLMSQRARVQINGAGDVKVWAMQDLDISTAGVGRVDFWGTAAVTRSSTGMVSINDHGPKR